MTPFSHYFRDLRMRLGIRQTDLAERIGYEQAYLSALEVGTKGPPNDELVDKLIQALSLDDAEQARLKKAVRESRKRYVVPADMPADIYRMISELWDSLESLHPAQVQMIREITRIKEHLNTTPMPERGRIVRQHREVAKM